MRESTIHAMDVLGGKGIMLGPNNYLGRGYQGAPIAITVEGANILTRNMIIYGQGAIRCHPFVLTELGACEIEDREEALNVFDATLALQCRTLYVLSGLRLVVHVLLAYRTKTTPQSFTV